MLQINDFDIRLAENADEVAASQALRYRTFYGGTGATASAEVEASARDADRFDAKCDHLLVIDRVRSNGTPKVVGTYRMLRRSAVGDIGQFYSADEFDLSALDGYPGEIMEAGRSCVDPDYRGRAIMQLLWGGIAEYVFTHKVALMLGCASFPGTEPAPLETALSFLFHNHLAPKHMRPRALAHRHVEMHRLGSEAVDPDKARAALPPLIKGYLRLGGMVGDGAVIDRQMNTLDVCLLLETERVTDRYYRHYRAGAGAAGLSA